MWIEATVKTFLTFFWLLWVPACHLFMEVPEGPNEQMECGNGQVDKGEDCDGENLEGATCTSLGYSQGSGELACTDSCTFDESLCVPKSADADLAMLDVEPGKLAPVFSPELVLYTVQVPASGENLAVSATASSPFATVIISPEQPMVLQAGVNEAKVTVTAEDGTQKEYTLSILRQSGLDYESPYIGFLAHVPGGTFQRNVTATNLTTVSAFRMSRFEITRGQWVAVTGWTDPSQQSHSGGVQDPVQRVSWYDAIAFCNKLSLQEGLSPVYEVSGVDFETLHYLEIPDADDATWNAVTVQWNANGYRLPTEMEWMWAAMGADTAAPGTVNLTGWMKDFAGSDGANAMGDYAVFGHSSAEPGATTTAGSNPVGSKLANELWLFDMSGNVREWVWDWIAPNPNGSLTDYRGPATGTTRLNRGGSWSNSGSWCALSHRPGTSPASRYSNYGFRVVRR